MHSHAPFRTIALSLVAAVGWAPTLLGLSASPAQALIEWSSGIWAAQGGVASYAFGQMKTR
jgi:hypothetical protein